MPVKPTRKITVTETTVLTQGLGKNNKEYTIWEVAARDEDGREITENLRTFEELPSDVLIEVELEVFNSDRHGRSFTLALPRNSPHKKERQSGNGLLDAIKQTMGELRAELDIVKLQVKTLRLQVAELRGEDAPPLDENEVVL